jgi:hypothetical protein
VSYRDGPTRVELDFNLSVEVLFGICVLLPTIDEASTNFLGARRYQSGLFNVDFDRFSLMSLFEPVIKDCIGLILFA